MWLSVAGGIPVQKHDFFLGGGMLCFFIIFEVKSVWVVTFTFSLFGYSG